MEKAARRTRPTSRARLMTERRKHIRLQTCDLVLVAWRDGTTDLNRVGNVQDLSPNGMGLLLDCRLPVGTQVMVSNGEEELNGVVRHVSEMMNGLFTGIEFATGAELTDVSSRSEAA